MKPQPKPATVERRHIVGREIRTEGGTDGKPLVAVGYAAVFESLSVPMWCYEGQFREILTRGCFSDTLKTADVRALYNHDDRLILSRTSTGTLKLVEDEVGLRFECPIPATSYGADLTENLHNGNLDGCSFGFRATAEGFEEPKDGDDCDVIRRVYRLDLVEISLGVTFPAYTDTSVSIRSIGQHLAARSAGQTARRLRLEKIRRFVDLI